MVKKTLKKASPLKKTKVTKSKVKKTTATKSKVTKLKKPKLLAGGNPQMAKADGNSPVQTYIAAMPDWKRKIGQKLDQLISKTVPKVQKAVKWNSPFYGMTGKGWFLSFHCYTRYVKVAFFDGKSLKPVPPGESKHNVVRYLDIHEKDKIDERQFCNWVKQASKLEGWGNV